MKNRKIILLTAFLVFCIDGCGKNEKSIIQEPYKEPLHVETGVESKSESTDKENAADLGDAEGTDVNATEMEIPSIKGIIKEQSFETKLDDWGQVFFASIAPADNKGEPMFALVKNEDIIYTFPKMEKSTDIEFAEVSAVAFRDYNQDGKQDVIALVTYSDGKQEWNEASIFLQENSDNMFYIDHPDLERYQIEEKAEGGPSFYRDTFLEEYLKTQKLTNSVADLLESWKDYMEYADGTLGILSVGQQIKLFAQNRQIWAKDIEYADDRYCFTLAGLTNDGRPVLIVSNQGGTGMYTYNEFYKIDKNGELQRLETSFKEGDSQPDIIEESMAVYSSFSKEGIKNHFIVGDELKESPDVYVYRISSLNISDDFVLETPLAIQRVVYEGENYSARITSEDCNGNVLTEEEYNAFADTYYENMGMTKKTAFFKWMDVKSLAGMSDKEVEEVLKQTYEGFSMKE